MLQHDLKFSAGLALTSRLTRFEFASIGSYGQYATVTINQAAAYWLISISSIPSRNLAYSMNLGK